MKRVKSFKSNFIILILIAVLSPTILIGSYSCYSNYKNLNQSYTSLSENSISRIQEGMQHILDTSFEEIEMISQDANVHSVYKSSESEPWMMNMFEKMVKTHENILSVYMGTEDKKMYAVPANTTEGYDPTSRPWYKAAVENKGKIITTEPYEDSREKGVYILSVAKAIEDASGKVIGVVSLDIKLDELAENVSKIKIGKEGYSIVLDKTGKIIIDKNKKNLGKSKKELNWLSQIVDSNKKYVEINGIEYLVNKEKNSEITAITLLPNKEIKVDILNQTIVTLIITIVIGAAAIVIAIIFSKKLTKPIQKMVQVLEKLKEGDFSNKIEKDSNFVIELEIIADSVNSMVDEIVSILKTTVNTSTELKKSSESLVSVTEESNAVGEEIAKAVQQISEGAISQTSQLESSHKKVEKFGELVDRSINNSDIMKKKSKEVKQFASDGIQIVENLKTASNEGMKVNKEVVEEFTTLENNARDVVSIIDTIKSIAEQTNLLALNASIEAARAGESGKGFAVVAEEVRKLAEESSLAADNIGELLNNMNNSVKELMKKIDALSNQNKEIDINVLSTNESFDTIKNSIDALEQNINKVYEVLEILNKDKSKIIDNISSSVSTSQETAATTEEVSASTEEQASGLHEIVNHSDNLNKMAEELQENISKFKY